MKCTTRFTLKTWLLLLAAVPLWFAVRWALAELPVSSSQYWLHSKWIDDRYVYFEYEYHPARTPYRFLETVSREYIVDCATGNRIELEPRATYVEHTELTPVTADGMLLRVRKESSTTFRVEKIDPATMETENTVIPRGDDVFFLGGKYLLYRAWDPATESYLLHWHNVTASLSGTVTRQFETYGGSISPIDGAAAFYLTIDGVPEPPDEEDATAQEFPAEWAAELRQLSQTQNPFGDDFVLALLYKMSDDGPELVTRWPARSSGIRSATSCILSEHIDRGGIDVRDATSGAITCNIPAPKGGFSSGTIHSNWGVQEQTLYLSGANGLTSETLSLPDGKPIDTRNALHRWVLAQTDTQYITAEDVDLRAPVKWPPGLQVRDRQTGEIVSEFDVAFDWSWGEFTENETKLKLTNEAGHIDFISVADGSVWRSVRPRAFQIRLAIAVIVTGLVWLGLFVVECNHRNLPWIAQATLLTLIALVFVHFRLHAAGHPEFHDRAAWQIVLAIFYAWGMAVALWVISARVVWYWRVLTAASAVSLCYFASDYAYGYGLACIVHIAVASVSFLIWATSQRALPPRQKPTRVHHFAMRDMLIATTFAAIAVAGVTRVDWSGVQSLLTSDRTFLIVTDACLCVAVAIVGWWCAHRLFRRSIPALVVACIAIGVRTILYSSEWRPFHIDSWMIEDEFWYAAYKFGAILGVIVIGFYGAGSSGQLRDGS